MMNVLFIYTLISWRWNFNVLPLFYTSHTNTIVLTIYISSKSLILKKPKRITLVKRLGCTKLGHHRVNKGLLENFKEIYEMTKRYKILRNIPECFTDVVPGVVKRGKTFR